MSKTFAIADLHGRFDLLEKAIAAIESYAPGGKIVFLGDYVDRGPQSRDVIDRLMSGPSDPSRWRWICLKGNHEDMMVECVGGRADLDWWVGNGGDATLASYGGEVAATHLDWCKKLPMIHYDGKRIFVHAAVDPSKDVREQSEAVMLWMRYPARGQIGHPSGHVVHGHTPNADGPEFYPGRTNLDTGAVFTGRLAVGVFDDDVAGAPVDLIEVLGEPDRRFGRRAAE